MKISADYSTELIVGKCLIGKLTELAIKHTLLAS